MSYILANIGLFTSERMQWPSSPSLFSSHTNITFVEVPSDKRQHLFCSKAQVGPAWGWVYAGPGSPLFRPLLFILMSAPFATYHPPNSWHFLPLYTPKLNCQKAFSLFFSPLLFPTSTRKGSYLISFWFARQSSTHTHTHSPRSGI